MPNDDDKNKDERNNTIIPIPVVEIAQIPRRCNRRSKLDEFKGIIYTLRIKKVTYIQIMFYLSDKVEVDASTIYR